MTIVYLSNNEIRLNSRVIGTNVLGMSLIGFLKSKELLKKMRETSIKLLIIDVECLDEAGAGIEKYLAINPDLVIFILVAPDEAISSSIFF